MRQDQEDRHNGISELAEKILAAATETYAQAPKLMLPGDSNPPPPLEWHASYTGAQFAEPLLRLLVLRKVQIGIMMAALKEAGDKAEKKIDLRVPKGFNDVLGQAVGEATRALEIFGIQLAQEI